MSSCVMMLTDAGASSTDCWNRDAPNTRSTSTDSSCSRVSGGCAASRVADGCAPAGDAIAQTASTARVAFHFMMTPAGVAETDATTLPWGILAIGGPYGDRCARTARPRTYAHTV